MIELEDGPPCVLPPDLKYLEPATPGEYQLHSSARVVAEPDFVKTWENIDHLEASMLEAPYSGGSSPIRWRGDAGDDLLKDPAWRKRVGSSL